MMMENDDDGPRKMTSKNYYGKLSPSFYSRSYFANFSILTPLKMRVKLKIDIND